MDSLKKYCTNYFKAKLEYPTLLSLQKYAAKHKLILTIPEARRFRNSLENSVKFAKAGKQGERSQHLFIQTRISTLGSVQFDLGFINMYGKHYGAFAIAIDILSRKVFVKKIPNKQFPTLNKFFRELFSEPGFTAVRKVYSDNEGGLSERNILSLETEFPGKRWILIGGKNTEHKAYLAENAIRNFKRLISKACSAEKISLSKWYTQIDRVLSKINSKPIKGTSFAPQDISRRNLNDFLDQLYKGHPHYELALYSIQAPLNKKDLKKLFLYNLGDEVVLRRSIHIDVSKDKEEFEKKSITGQFSTKEKVYVIIERRLVQGRDHVFPIYKIKAKYAKHSMNRIFKENDIRMIRS